MSEPLFDRALIDRRRARVRAREAPEHPVLGRVREDLDDRLAAVLRRFATAVDVGAVVPGTGDVLRARGVSRVVRLDTVPGGDVIGRLDALPFRDGSIDLAVSLLALQAVDDLPGALVQIRRMLKPDGLFLGAALGGRTLSELREAFTRAEAEMEGGVSPRVAPFADVRDMGGLLQRAGFALPVTDVDTLTLRYADPFALMAELRALGAANPLVARRRTPLRRATLLRAVDLYARAHAAPDGRIPATVEIVWLSGWAPHESQQRPLKPGSATARLADALGVKERSAGDKAGGR